MAFTQEDANAKVGALLVSNWILEKAIKELTEENAKLKVEKEKEVTQ